MKTYDLVKLKNEKLYKRYKLQENTHGIVLESNCNNPEVLFFNPNNQEEYIIVKTDIKDIIKENHNLPDKILEMLNSKLDYIKRNAKGQFDPIKIKVYDMVELIVENEKYARYGVHKGYKGCVMEDCVVGNQIEVDFSRFDKSGKFYGDCISVNIDDLKLVKNVKPD